MATLTDHVFTTINENGLWRTIQERKRSTTDIAWLAIYGILVTVWSSIGIYAYCNSEISHFELYGSMIMQLIREGFLYHLAILFFSWICALFIICYFIMLRWCTKFCVYFTLFLKFLVASIPLIAIIFEIHPVIVIPVLCLSYLIFWIEVKIMKKVEINTICRIIQDACRVTMAFPSSLLIMLLFVFTTTLFSIFIATVLKCLNSFPPVITYTYVPWPSESYSKIIKPVNNDGLIITFSICSIWILLANYLCMKSVLHGMFTTWCKMANNGIISNFTIALYYLILVYRYHIGTFVYMSAPIAPLVHIIRIIIANIHQLQMKLKESRYNIYCFCVIIVSSITNSSVVCAYYGKSFNVSMKAVFQEIIQNPMKFTAIRLITIWIILVGLILIPSVMIGLSAIPVVYWRQFDCGIFILIIGYISLIITSAVLCIFSTAIDSVLFCYFENVSEKGKSRDENIEDNKV